MKSEILLDAIGKIDDELIASAGEVRDRSRIKMWLRCGALAACLALVVGVCSVAGWFAPNESLPELPMLTISENLGGMGFEGYMAYDISELVNANPWNKRTKLSTLPVYENKIKYDILFHVSGNDLESMKAYLDELVDKLGMDKQKLVYDDNTPHEKQIEATMRDLEALEMLPVPDNYFDPNELTASDGNISVTVNAHMDVDIVFENGISLPPEYNFTHYAPLDDVTKVAKYLKEKYLLGEYKDIIGMKSPVTNISEGDYSIYGEQHYYISFFEKSRDKVENIINYNLKQVSFFCNDDGKLWLIRIDSNACTEKIGDYPIISAKEAKKLLLNGNYITSVPYDLPGKEYIKKVELIYRTDVHDEYFIPYYRFYIELPEVERDGGIKTYGAYYVPAVREEYIENMPLWNGSFN